MSVKIYILAEHEDIELIETLSKKYINSVILNIIENSLNDIYFFSHFDRSISELIDYNDINKSLIDMYVLFLTTKGIIDSDKYTATNHLKNLWIAIKDKDIDKFRENKNIEREIIDVRISLYKEQFEEFLEIIDKVSVKTAKTLMSLFLNILDAILEKTANNISSFSRVISDVKYNLDNTNDFFITRMWK